MLTKYPTIKVQIHGHTDNRADAAYNQIAQRERGPTRCVRRSIERGIAADRMTTKGFGSTSSTVAPNDTDANLAKNRRIEFVVQ